MRVIAGTFRSRPLKSLPGLALRPTSDRLRETLFNVLGSGVAESRFLDLFAGTGAIGIEAVSRGASEVVFVEKHPSATLLIRRNLKSLGIESGITVLGADVIRGLGLLMAPKNAAKALFDYVFLDPPYAATEDYARVLKFIAGSDLLAPAGIVVAEHRRNFELPDRFGELQRFRMLKQGDAALSFYRRTTGAAGDSGSAK